MYVYMCLCVCGCVCTYIYIIYMCMNVRVYMHNKSLHKKDSLLVQKKSSMVRDPYLVKAPSTQDVTILCL